MRQARGTDHDRVAMGIAAGGVVAATQRPDRLSYSAVIRTSDGAVVQTQVGRSYTSSTGLDTLKSSNFKTSVC